MAASEILRRIPFLKSLDAPALERIARRLPERRYPKGARLFFEGEPCPGFWIVKEGSVNIYKVTEEGRVHILESCGAGGVFALVSALDGGAYPACAETREDSVLIFFPREELLAALAAAPQAAVAVAKTFAARLRRLTCQAASVALCDVRARLAAYLLDASEQRGIPQPDGSIEVVLDATQQEVARRIGTVREVLARALKSLADARWIERRRDAVRLLDCAALKRVAARG
jgi:CRP/FNR family transcriptional regulator